VKRGELLCNFNLHYLICQYRKLKLETKNKIPKAYAAWDGHQILDLIYIFSYGAMNPTVTPLIPDFMCREKANSLS